jgi:hypothetical protein
MENETMSGLSIMFFGDLAPLQKDEVEALRIIDKVNGEIEKSQQKLRTTIRGTLRAVSSVIATVRSVAACFGIAIPPIFDAVLSAVTSTVLAMQGIAAAYAAGGVTAVVAVPIEAAAIALSWLAVIWVAAGRSDVERELSLVESTLRSAGSTANAFEHLTEGF